MSSSAFLPKPYARSFLLLTEYESAPLSQPKYDNEQDLEQAKNFYIRISDGSILLLFSSIKHVCYGWFEGASLPRRKQVCKQHCLGSCSLFSEDFQWLQPNLLNRKRYEWLVCPSMKYID